MQCSTQKRLPTLSDFVACKNCIVNITPPPKDSPACNVLILAHGLGDTEVPFTNLAAQLNLPQTVCLSVRGPKALPFHDNGFHWSDDLIFDSTTSALDPDGGFASSTELFRQIIQDILISTCGFALRDIVLFGLGQGGMAMLNIAVQQAEDLAGVVSIGGPLPSSAPASSAPLKTTPILLCCGSESRWADDAAQDRLRRNFKHVQVSKYKRKGDGMPQSRDEMLPIMEFFSRRLQQAAPAGTVEVTT